MLSIYLHTYTSLYITIHVALSLKEIQKNVYTKTSFFFILTNSRTYLHNYVQTFSSIYRLKKNINMEQCSSIFFLLFSSVKKERTENPSITILKATIRPVEFGYVPPSSSFCSSSLTISRGNYQSQYSSLFCTMPCFIRQSGQYHLPLGGTIIPTHSKWNHSIRQSSPSQAIISETSSYGQRQ